VYKLLTNYIYQFSEHDLKENKLGRISHGQEYYFKQTGKFLLLFFFLIGIILSAGLYFTGLSSFTFSIPFLVILSCFGLIIRKKYQISIKDSTVEIVEGPIKIYTSQINFSSNKNNSGIEIKNRRFVTDINLFESGSSYRLYITKRYFLLSWEKVEDAFINP
jgi:hypothetical protein